MGGYVGRSGRRGDSAPRAALLSIGCRAITSQIGLSVETVDRHVSNIFVKLNVPTRAAATAHAYRHGLAQDNVP
jgi:DNA-binding CsgD family transcriptional regulator